MKIGFDAKRAFLNRAGLGNYSRNTLVSLKEYFPGNQYVLFTPETKGGLFPMKNNFTVYSPASPSLKIYKSLWRSFFLSSVIKNKGIGLYHGLTHELPSGIHKTGIKTVVTIHDLIFLRYPQYYKPIDRKIYLRKIKYACNVANRIIAISNQTKNDIVDFLDIEPSKIEVVFQSISNQYFSKSTMPFSELKNKYKLPGQYILSVGTIEPRKNQKNILRAIKSEGIDMPVVFVGRATHYAAEVSGYANENGMAGKVLMLNNVADNEMPGLYANASLLIYISEFEGFGLPVVEAMASGCPVVTSNTSCLPETSGGAAVLCNPCDVEDIGVSVKKVLENHNLKSQLVNKGINRAKDFSGKKTSEALFNVYNKIIEND